MRLSALAALRRDREHYPLKLFITLKSKLTKLLCKKIQIISKNLTVLVQK
jgi:hypothetical protein